MELRKEDRYFGGGEVQRLLEIEAAVVVVVVRFAVRKAASRSSKSKELQRKASLSLPLNTSRGRKDNHNPRIPAELSICVKRMQMNYKII